MNLHANRTTSKTILTKKLLALAFVATLMLAFLPTSLAQDTDFISGHAASENWQVDISGNSGTISIDGKVWNIEYFQKTPGLNGFAQVLSFVGREDENFIRVDVFVNSIGEDFLIFYYDYKQNALESDRFEGSYRVGELDNSVSRLEGYLPRGLVPSYTGQDFVIESEIAQVTANSGVINFDGREITVYPVRNVVVSESWSEFWSVGIDRDSGRSYFMIFFRTDTGFLLDLWTGEISEVRFGEALLTGENVVIERDFNLEDLLNN